MGEGRVRKPVRWRWVAVMVTAAVLAGCGNATFDVPTQQGGRLGRALRAWSGFPVSASPRPLVLVGPPVANPRGGFPDGATKLAYIEGAVAAPVSLPSGPATGAGYPLISARQAFSVFKSVAGKGPPATARLHISAVRVGVGLFGTDRGLLRLPAWLFWFREFRAPAAVLAVALARIFSPPNHPADRPPFVDDARLGPGGRILTVDFVGMPSGTGPCTADYRLIVAESRTAVAVAVREHPHGTGEICALAGYGRHATTVLHVRLGARVVVDAVSRTAVAVTQAAG